MWTEGSTVGHTTASTVSCFLCFVLFVFVWFLFRGRLQGWRVDMEGNAWDWGVHDVKFTKNQ